MVRYLTLGVVNAIFCAVIYVLFREGIAQQAAENDIMYIMPTMGAIFILGMVMVHFVNETAYWCAESLIALGFLGTLLGIWSAFTGINQDQVGDVNAIGSVLATLLTGLGAALWTTILGAFLNLWLNANIRAMGG